MSTLGFRKNGQIDLIDLRSIQKPSATDPRNIGADVNQVKLFLNKVKPDLVIADIGDSGDKVAQLIDFYGEGKVFGCEYKSSPKSTGQLKPTWNEQQNKVTVDKIMQNKRFIGMLKEGYIHHPNIPNERKLQLYLTHWQNVFIREEIDDKTGEPYQVIGKRNGEDDHWAQASVYAMIGLERLKEIHFGTGKYGFTSDFVDLQYTGQLEQPDIFSRH